MSTNPEAPVAPHPSTFTTGSDRYIEFVRYFFGIESTEIQRRLLRAVADHKRVLAVGANGPGKSYIAAALNGAFLYSNSDSICMPTSGTYSVLDDTLWKPLRGMIRTAQEIEDLPGRPLENPPRIQIDDEWFFKAVSPTHPQNLEGRHAGTMLVTIEEADKPDITREHIDSAESMITDDNDRMLVTANPPESEGNVVYDLMEDDNWHVIQFSSFESRNVRIDLGEIEGAGDDEKVPGLVDLETVKYDWERWNNEPWPGADAARIAHVTRSDLDTRWYRRRAGVIPPESASAHRPITVAGIEAAFERPLSDADSATIPQGLGFDVARMGGDSNALAGVFRERLDVLDTWQGVDHIENEARVRTQLGPGWGATLAVDATGEGSGLGDRIQTWYPDTHRFNAGGEAADRTEYKDCWAEGLYHLGQFLKTGSFTDRRLREELLAAARTVEYEERYYASRGTTVLTATSKSAIKDQLGRSPDVLDAAMQAVWAAKTDRSVGIPEPGGTWYNPQ